MRRKSVSCGAVRLFGNFCRRITYDSAWDNYSQEVRYDFSNDSETPEFCDLLDKILKEENPNIAIAIQTLLNAKRVGHEFPPFQLHALMCRVEAMETRMKHDLMTSHSEYQMLVVLKKKLNDELLKHASRFSP